MTDAEIAAQIDAHEGSDQSPARIAAGALIEQATSELYKSLTWDRGQELTDHRRFTLTTNIDVYFCDPQPWPKQDPICSDEGQIFIAKRWVRGELLERRLAAVLAADVAGYDRKRRSERPASSMNSTCEP